MHHNSSDRPFQHELVCPFSNAKGKMQNHPYLNEFFFLAFFATKRVHTNTYFERAPLGDRSRCGRGGGGRTKANLGIMRPTTGRSLSRSHYHKMPGCTADPRLDGIGRYYIAGY